MPDGLKGNTGELRNDSGRPQKRALEVKKQDEGLRKRELEVKERKEQQVLKTSQRALKGSVSHTMLRPDFNGMTSVVPDSSKADV
jgi:hypothetical protein